MNHDSENHSKVSVWLNNTANDFSHFENHDENNWENRSNLASDDIVSDEGEFISVSQQSVSCKSEKNLVKQCRNRKKVYKSCVKPTKKQLKLRQLPKLFDNEPSAASRTRKKPQCKPLVDLNNFIDSIKVGNQQCCISKKSSFNKTIEYNTSIQHYLSPEKVLSQEQQKMSSSVSEHTNTDSDPDWSESIDLHNVFAKQKKYKTTHFKFQLNNSISNIAVTDSMGKDNIKNHKKLSKNKSKLSEKADLEEKQTNIRTFRLRSMFNNRFIHKAKSIKEAEEIYNKYKFKRNSTENVKKHKNSKINHNSDDQDILFKTKSCEKEQNNLINCVNEEFVCNVQPLKKVKGNIKSQNNLDGCNQHLSNKKIKCNFAINKNNTSLIHADNITNLLENNIVHETNFGNTQFQSDNNQGLQVNIAETEKIKSNKVRKVKKKRKNRKSKSLNRRSSVLQSPGWSKLVGKLNELNVNQHKCHKRNLNVTGMRNTNLKNHTNVNNSAKVNKNQVNMRTRNRNKFQDLDTYDINTNENLNCTGDGRIANDITNVYANNVSDKVKFDLNNNNRISFTTICDALKYNQTVLNVNDENITIIKNDPLLPGIPNSFSWCNLLINNSNKILEWPNVDSVAKDVLNDNELLLSYYVKGDSLESDNSSSVIPPSIPDISDRKNNLLYFRSLVNRRKNC